MAAGLWVKSGARALAALTLAIGLAGAALAQPQGPASVSGIAERVTPAVVNISTTRTVGRSIQAPRAPDGSPLEDLFERFGDQGGRRVSSLGSGFLIDPEGLIVTNNHVIDGADEVLILFPNGDEIPAEVLGTDDKTDIAVLKIEGEAEFPFVELGDSDSAKIGDWVMVVGNPFGLGGSVSLGIVSARNRDIQSGPYDSYIQTDAAINQGNSGGPLFDMNGQVVGINTAIIAAGGTSLGIGFAVPINQAVPIISQLVEFGETRRGWLGVGIQDVTRDIADTLDLPDTSGALVLSITAEGPSDGYLEEGDIIMRFDGREITRMRDLPIFVAETRVGKLVEVEILRGGERMTLEVELGRLETIVAEAEPEEALPGSGDDEAEPGAEEPVIEPGALLGLRFDELTDELRERFALNDRSQGVVITQVDPLSDAFDKGIRAGLSIVEINQVPVASPAQVSDMINTAVEEGRPAVLIMLADRSGNRRFVAVRLDR